MSKEATCALLPNVDNETCLTQGSGYDRACDLCRVAGWPDLKANLDGALRVMAAKTASDWERLSLDAIDMGTDGKFTFGQAAATLRQLLDASMPPSREPATTTTPEEASQG